MESKRLAWTVRGYKYTIKIIHNRFNCSESIQINFSFRDYFWYKFSYFCVCTFDVSLVRFLRHFWTVFKVKEMDVLVRSSANLRSFLNGRFTFFIYLKIFFSHTHEHTHFAFCLMNTFFHWLIPLSGFCFQWNPQSEDSFQILGKSPADADVLMTSSEHLKKVRTSYDQTRRLHDVWQKTSDLWRLEDVLFTSSGRPLFYDVLKTSDLRRIEDVGFTSSWRRPMYNVLKTSDLWRLGDVWFTAFWRRLIYDFLMTYVKRCLWRKQRLHNIKMNYIHLSCIVWNIDNISSVPLRLALRYEIL